MRISRVSLAAPCLVQRNAPKGIREPIGFVAFVACASLAFAGAPPSVAAAVVVYSGQGGSGSAPFFLSQSTACRYAATLRILQLRVALDGNKVASAYLSTTMTETNAYCQAAPLGEKQESYTLKKGTFDGHRLRLAFDSAKDNAARHDVVYDATKNGNSIVGVATFRRYDCSAACNWTVKAAQKLTPHR